MDSRTALYFERAGVWLPGRPKTTTQDARQDAYAFWSKVCGWKRRAGSNEIDLKQKRMKQVVEICGTIQLWQVTTRSGTRVPVLMVYSKAYYGFKGTTQGSLDFWYNFWDCVQERVESKKIRWRVIEFGRNAARPLKGFIW